MFTNSSHINYSTTPVTGNADFTMSAWCKFEDSSDYNAVLYMGGATTNNSVGFYRDTGASGTIKASFYGGAGVTDSGVIAQLNRWYHVILIGNSTADTLSLYVDGIYKATGASVAYNITGTNANVIGRYAQGTGTTNWSLTGMVDEVIIESRAWTAKEIETYYRKSVLNYRKQGFLSKLLQSFSISENLSLTENVSNIRTRLFSIAETTTLSETVSTLKGLAFSVSESLGLVEAYNYAQTFVFSVSDTLGLTEVTVSVSKLWNNITKSVTSWTTNSKSSTTWTDRSKNQSSWTNKNKS